jgi:hypothetical protein
VLVLHAACNVRQGDDVSAFADGETPTAALVG